MRLKRILLTAQALVVLFGLTCTVASCRELLPQSEGETQKSTETQGSTEAQPNETDGDSQTEGEKYEGERYHILITSDMHYTELTTYYNTDRETRLQYWVDGILAEHQRDPFDLIIILGDVSLDYWGWNGGGSYQRKPSVSDTKLFMERYASQLPKDVPMLVLPGNHELYTNEKWKELTGNDRNESFVLGDNLFVIPDSYSRAVDPKYQGSGKNDSPYKAVDMEFIRGEIDKHPECNNIYLVSHHFDLSQESKEFKNLLKTESRIVGLFSGHTHSYKAKKLGSEYNSIYQLQTGNFADYGDKTAESFSWGFRDLIIEGKKVTSTYIIPNCSYYVDGVKYTVERKYADITLLRY